MGSKSKKEGICILKIDSLCCTVETNTIFLSNYTPIKINKKIKIKVWCFSLLRHLKTWTASVPRDCFTCHNSSQVSYLGENGEMSWVSLAQVMMGGGKPFTSHGRVTSSPAKTEISTGLSWDGPLWSPNTLGLTKTNTGLGRERVHWNKAHFKLKTGPLTFLNNFQKDFVDFKVWGHI